MRQENKFNINDISYTAHHAPYNYGGDPHVSVLFDNTYNIVSIYCGFYNVGHHNRISVDFKAMGVDPNNISIVGDSNSKEMKTTLLEVPLTTKFSIKNWVNPADKTSK